ncbi:uncharacterized protein AB675_1917 [Cyphellophora attinorum]|uniref:Beta-1,4-mannosyl-glycoprotein 4-beta-N-acetylglucosaminyltransferase n=1 Tax=Cyphellophora attinorum TaxID=1664694 RepID=A0A0N1HU01_9EURO|nr:uncharacterized protein AB675_1917 [Phialophora attinorum]KPI42700.1 hypothetical protein AB675_1917 [Phialophora attinorum]
MSLVMFSKPMGRVLIGVISLVVILALLFHEDAHRSFDDVLDGRVPDVKSWSPKLPKLPSWSQPQEDHTSFTSSPFGFMPDGPELDAMCTRYRWETYPHRYQRRKIYDLVLLNDELDSLALRMGQMHDVDYFVVVESDLTFSDHQKPLHVLDNWAMFNENHHKMIRVTLNMTGQTFGDAWARETFSRNAMFDQVFPNLQNEQAPNNGDVIIVGDVDELVRPEILIAMRNCQITERVKLWTRFYYYSFQWLHPEGHAEWGHPDATFFQGLNDTILPQSLRTGGATTDIYSAGWHCSYCFGDLQAIVNKVKSFSHQEMNTPDFTDPSKILQRVRNGVDLFNRGNLYRIDKNLDVPDFVTRNIDRFGWILNRDGEDGGFRDTWDLISREQSNGPGSVGATTG